MIDIEQMKDEANAIRRQADGGVRTALSAMPRHAQMIGDAATEIERLRAYIWSLDGRTICFRGEGDTFIDDGVIVASDICPMPGLEQGAETKS